MGALVQDTNSWDFQKREGRVSDSPLCLSCGHQKDQTTRCLGQRCGGSALSCEVFLATASGPDDLTVAGINIPVYKPRDARIGAQARRQAVQTLALDSLLLCLSFPLGYESAFWFYALSHNYRADFSLYLEGRETGN